jgi:hypothetical protein
MENNNKKSYSKPTIEVIKYQSTQILCTSQIPGYDDLFN